MFTHDACVLEVKQHCDSTPLRGEGKFAFNLGPKTEV